MENNNGAGFNLDGMNDGQLASVDDTNSLVSGILGELGEWRRLISLSREDQGLGAGRDGFRPRNFNGPLGGENGQSGVNRGAFQGSRILFF